MSLFPFWLDFGSTDERLLREILANQIKMMRSLNIIDRQGEIQMADFSKLVAEVEATRGAVESTKAFVKGLEAELSKLGSNMNDEEDQAKVEALAADLARIREALPKAVVANPVPTEGGPVDSGASAGGNLG
jgi:ADP-dependent phosphofructokinase/glucokinase